VLRPGCRVFAYGSNLAVGRIEARVGPVVTLASGGLDRHALRFHKSGRDGSGKADAYETGDAKDVLYGIVYEMSIEAKNKLDRFEGLGSDYLQKDVVIATARADIAATVYYAHPARIDPAAVPFDWYLRLVIEGARQHRLPRAYVERIAMFPSREDPDRVRVETALRALAKR
jgi:gamma-glutamylcyclotransferase